MAQSVCLILGNRREIIWQNRKNVICRTVSNHVEKNAFIKSCVSYHVRWCNIMSDDVVSCRIVSGGYCAIIHKSILWNIYQRLCIISHFYIVKNLTKYFVKSFTKKIVNLLSNIVKSVTKNIVKYLSKIVKYLSKLVKNWTMILWNSERS